MAGGASEGAAVATGAVAAAGALCAVDGASGGVAGAAGVVAAGAVPAGAAGVAALATASAGFVSVGFDDDWSGEVAGAVVDCVDVVGVTGIAPVVVGAAGVVAAAGVVCAPTLEAVVASAANATVTAATRVKAVVSINLGSPRIGTRHPLTSNPAVLRISITAGTAWRFHAQNRVAVQRAEASDERGKSLHGTEKTGELPTPAALQPRTRLQRR